MQKLKQNPIFLYSLDISNWLSFHLTIQLSYHLYWLRSSEVGANLCVCPSSEVQKILFLKPSNHLTQHSELFFKNYGIFINKGFQALNTIK
jgi:hypothetical protein